MLVLAILAACCLFVGFLLRLDRQQASSVTTALWLPSVWILYTGSKPLNAWFPAFGATAEVSPADRAFLIVLLVFALGILARRKFPWSATFRDNRALMVLMLYMVASILWSTSPATSVTRLFRSIQAVIMAFVVMTEPSPRQAVETILRRITYVLIPFSVVLIKYFPQFGREYGRWGGETSWVGVTLQKNGLGRLCLIAMLYLLWSLRRRWKNKETPAFRYQTAIDLVILAMTLWLMRGPRGGGFSATALISATLAAAVFAALQTARKSGFKTESAVTIGLIAVILIGTVSVFTGGAFVGSFSSYVGRNRTLTDRTVIWQLLVPIAMQQPVLGKGFGGVYTPATRDQFRIGDSRITEAHNGYLDVILSLGFVGLLLVSAFVLSSGRKAQRILSEDYEWGSFWITFLVAALIHNISESSIHVFQTQLTAVLIFFSVTSFESPASPEEAVPEIPSPRKK